MPRIIDYTSLKQSVLATLEREQDLEALGLFDEWVSLCEGAFAPVLKAPWGTRFAQFTWGNDPLQRFEFLPPSYNGMITVIDLITPQTLDPINPSEIPRFMRVPVGFSNDHRIGGIKRYNCVIGFTLHVFPDPGLPGIPLMLEYYSRDEPLTPVNPVNTVIVQDPNIYKFGVLVQAYHHYGEQQNHDRAFQKFEQAIAGNNELDAGWRRGAGARVSVTR